MARAVEYFHRNLVPIGNKGRSSYLCKVESSCKAMLRYLILFWKLTYRYQQSLVLRHCIPQIFANWFWGTFHGTGKEVVNGALSCQSPLWRCRVLQKSKVLEQNTVALPMINVALNCKFSLILNVSAWSWSLLERRDVIIVSEKF